MAKETTLTWKFEIGDKVFIERDVDQSAISGDVEGGVGSRLLGGLRFCPVRITTRFSDECCGGVQLHYGFSCTQKQIMRLPEAELISVEDGLRRIGLNEERIAELKERGVF